ncbi:MAG: efflux RND transporter periplasmic adaptor subunit [Actinobacteria bacterium]|nr:efflux RND transporter periplasmic adaptor subunit [Actinomycetota bacterium]
MTVKAKVIIGVVSLLAIGAIAGFIFLRQYAPAEEVTVTEVLQEDLRVTISATGEIQLAERRDVFPGSAGIIDEVLVTDGQQVAAGAVLATLEREPLELQLAQAEAGLAAARSQLAAVERQEPTSAELASARRATEAAWSQHLAALAGVDAVGRQAPTQSDLQAARAAAAAAKRVYDSAKQAHDAAKAAYLLSPSPSLEASLAQAEIAMLQARAGYSQAEAAKEKAESFDATQLRRQAAAARDQTHAAFLAARAQQQRLERTELSAERAAASAAVDQAREAVALAHENLEKASLTAPIDGVVLFNPVGTPAADGEIPKVSAASPVGPQAAPFTILNLESAYFLAEVDEADIAKVEPGIRAAVNLDAFPAEGIEGSVTRISPMPVMTATGGTTYSVYIDFGDTPPPIDLLVGMRGDVEIEIDAVEDVLTVPVEALFDEDGAFFVYLVDPDMMLARTPVEVGTLTEVKAEIVSGISEGDEVALSGPAELTDGLRVRVER